MGIVQRLCRLFPSQALPQTTDNLRETNTVDQLHRVKVRPVLAEFVEWHNIGMAQL